MGTAIDNIEGWNWHQNLLDTSQISNMTIKRDTLKESGGVT